MVKRNVWERVRYWRARCSAYNPFFPITLRQREGLFQRIVKEICVNKERGIVLDVGTGTGRLPLLLAEVAPEITCIGIDLNAVLLQKAKQISSEKHFNDRISFLQADVQALPFANLSIDSAVSVASLHQWPDRVKGIKELYRVLKNQGIVRIWVSPMLMWLWDFFKRNLANCKDLKVLFETTGFKGVLAGSEDVFLRIFGRK